MENNFVELRGIRKTFGPLVANDAVSFSVKRGSIHAVVGENGAGKSTAMKVLYGQYKPDGGEIFIGGKSCRWRHSGEAIRAGLGMVHQHFMLAGSHTAVENVLLASESSSLGLLPVEKARARLENLMREFQMEVRLDLPVCELSVGEQQRVEILKLLYRDSGILILDEPTAVLAPGEIGALFSTLRGMAERGKTILIITHKLKEVMALAHEVTVFRAGRVVGRRAVAETSVAQLAELMVGRQLDFGTGGRRAAPGNQPVLELKGAKPSRALSRLDSVSFAVNAGEILGIAGVEGNGQSELIRLLLSPRDCLAAGEIRLLDQDISRWSASRLRAEAEIALFPEDRLREALLLDSPACDNFLLGRQRRQEFRRHGFLLDTDKVEAAAAAAMRDYDVRPANTKALAREFSGGNQQKLVVARELSGNPRFLLAAQPTRGVDIGAIEFIHGRMLELRDRGAGVLLVSSELDEVLKLSDRVLVFYRGRVVGEFARAEFDESRVGLLMAGGAERGGS
jgi:general nucleoside transport system ATP-binding protein